MSKNSNITSFGEIHDKEKSHLGGISKVLNALKNSVFCIIIASNLTSCASKNLILNQGKSKVSHSGKKSIRKTGVIIISDRNETQEKCVSGYDCDMVAFNNAYLDIEGIHFTIGDTNKEIPTIEQVEFYIKTTGGELEQIAIPEEIGKKLITYLINQQTLELKAKKNGYYFDCLQFAHFLFDFPVRDVYTTVDITVWIPQKLSYSHVSDIPKQLHIGDVILIGTGGWFTSYHYAIYLGKGIFVSKHGQLSIFFENISALNENYVMKTVHKLIPIDTFIHSFKK